MTEIDWSQAPEGATHYSRSPLLSHPWHKVAGDEIYFFGNESRGWLAYTVSVSEEMLELEPRPSAPDALTTPPSKYHRQIHGVWLDVYDILTAYGVTNPADAHAIKKMLMPGQRGEKDGIKDRREAIASIERAIRIEEEKQ